MTRDLQTLGDVRIFVEAAQVYLRAMPPNVAQARVSVDAALTTIQGRVHPVREWTLERRLRASQRMQTVADRQRALRGGGAR